MSVAPLVLVVVVLCAVSRSQGQDLMVFIDAVYTSPADFDQPTINDFRAGSGPVTLTCEVVEGATGTVTYQWTSTCGNCFAKGQTSQSVTGNFFRVDRESGTHTCTATDSNSGRTGSADFVMRIIGIGVFVFKWPETSSVPTGALPNNGIVVALSTRTDHLTFAFQCRSGSGTDTSVRQFIGLNGQPRGTGGALGVGFGLSAIGVNNQDRSDLSAGEEGVYTCRMLDENGDTVEANVGIYRNGFNTPPSITSLTFDPYSFTLTCTSIGSPATTVTWMKDGSPLVIDGTTYSMEQTVPDAGRPTSTYNNVLTIVDSGSSFGTYSCNVSNVLGSSGPTAIGAADPAIRLGAPQVGTYIKVHWIGTLPPTPQSGYRIFFEGGGEPGSAVVPTTDATSHTVRVQNDVTYTFRIQLFSTTQLPSAEVTVQSRRAPVVVFGDETLPSHRIVPNHGIVDRDDIGDGLVSSALQCLTNNLDCCDQNSGAFWYFPDMTEIPGLGTVYSSDVVGPGFGLTLYREVGATLEGIFHCRIPDENGDPYDQYVGVYGPGAGAVTKLEGQLTVLTEDPPLFVLTCTSEGGPASTVTWSWNGVPVTEDNNHVVLQSVVNGETAEYNNSLTVRASEFGTYTCTVNNDRTSIALSKDIEVVAPPSPVGLTVTQGTPTTFTVSWRAPSFVPITGYRVTYSITGIAVEAVVELSASELQWSSPPLDESRTYDITVAVQTLSDPFPSAPENAPIPLIPSGPVIGLEGSPSLSQITVSWDEIAANAVIIRYELQYTSTDGSLVITKYTGSPLFVIEERNHGTDYTFSVTPFSLFAHGQSEERTVSTLSEPPQVGGVGVRVLSATSVLVFWDRVPLPLEELRGYRVNYREVVQARKRLVNGNGTDEGSRNFSSEATSGVVDGLRTGVNYQFQVTALAVTLDGTSVEGDASEENDNTMAVPAEQPTPNPVGLNVTQGTPTTFTISWSAPPFDRPITGYRVTYSITGIAVGAVVELSASELQWSSPPLDESRTYDITVAVQTLSDSFPSAPENAPIPQIPSGPVSSLDGSPSLSQITVSWDEIAANMVIIRYEVQYTSTDGSSVITGYTDSPPFVIEERNHGTDYTFSVTPFSLFAHGLSVERTVQTLSEPPQVGGVGVSVLSATAVLVSWDPVPHPLEELTGYRVDYREVVQARKRQPQCTCEQFREFPGEATSGVVDGLRTGVNYQFQVTALAETLDGTSVEGEASEESDDTMAVPSTREEEEDDGDFSTGELVGAVVATFFITLLVYTVVLVTSIAVLRFQRKRGYSVEAQTPADVPLKECLAYGEVRGSRQMVEGRGGGGGEEEAHIYEPTDLAMEVLGDDGDYEN